MNELLLILRVLRDPAWSAISVLVSILLAKLSKIKANSKSLGSSQKEQDATTPKKGLVNNVESQCSIQLAIQRSRSITFLIQEKDQSYTQIVIIFVEDQDE